MINDRVFFSQPFPTTNPNHFLVCGFNHAYLTPPKGVVVPRPSTEAGTLDPLDGNLSSVIAALQGDLPVSFHAVATQGQTYNTDLFETVGFGHEATAKIERDNALFVYTSALTSRSAKDRLLNYIDSLLKPFEIKDGYSLTIQRAHIPWGANKKTVTLSVSKLDPASMLFTHTRSPKSGIFLFDSSKPDDKDSDFNTPFVFCTSPSYTDPITTRMLLSAINKSYSNQPTLLAEEDLSPEALVQLQTWEKATKPISLEFDMRR
jgi:hypothetical protein